MDSGRGTFPAFSYLRKLVNSSEIISPEMLLPVSVVILQRSDICLPRVTPTPDPLSKTPHFSLTLMKLSLLKWDKDGEYC